MNPGAGDQFLPYEFPQYPPGWIYPLPGPYMFNDRGNPSPSPSTTSTDSLPESPQFSEDSSMPASTSTSSCCRSRWGKEEEKLLVQLCKMGLTGLHGKSHSHRTAWCGVCSQILFSSATVAFRTNFLSLADFKSDLSRTNLKLPSSAT